MEIGTHLKTVKITLNIFAVYSVDFCPKTGHLCCISSHASGLVLEVGFRDHKRKAFVQINNFEVTDEFQDTDPWIARPTSWCIQNPVQVKSNS